jgi:hypothetical protein
MLSALLAYYLLNSWVWYGFCVYQQLGYVVYRRVLKYYSGEEDGLGNCNSYLQKEQTGENMSSCFCSSLAGSIIISSFVL